MLPDDIVVPKGMVPKSLPKLLDEKTIVRTGALFNMTEKELDKFLTYYGAKVGSSVNKSTYCVVEGTDPGETKLSAAAKNGVQIFTET